MEKNICPLCANPVQPNERSCSNCGVDLALATALTERALLRAGAGEEPKVAVAPEVLVPRLGERLVEQKLLTEEQLQTALAFQKKQAEAGAPILLGQALTKLGMVDQATLDRAVTQQIFQLQDALRKANLELEARVQARTRALQQALQRLSELTRLKGNFVGNISHELRTPLTHLKGYSEMLAESTLGPLNPEQQSAVEVMRRSSGKLEVLIEDLIRFSDSTQAEIPLRLQPVSVRLLLTDALAQSQKKIDQGSLKLQIMVPDKVPDVRCDREKIGWVILHLIDNAVKFTPRGGQISVEASVKEGFVRIAIRDTGIGIPVGKVDEIFEPFHQLESDSNRRFPGAGLGLSLVKRILLAHKTDIDVRSTPGAGSTFSFRLPVTDQRLVSSAPAEKPT